MKILILIQIFPAEARKKEQLRKDLAEAGTSGLNTGEMTEVESVEFL